MDRVTVHFENCYGIRRLDKSFKFSQAGAYAIYAPNGVMKSSFAQTFQDAAAQKPSSDRIFPGRRTVRQITDGSGNEIEGEHRILVVLPYDDGVAPTEKTSTLLVNSKLKEEYIRLHVETDKAKKILVDAIKKHAESRADFSKEISSAITRSDNRFDDAMVRVRSEIARQKDTPLSSVKYDKIFDDKVINAIQGKDLKTAIEGYIKRYNELLAASTYFKKGVFDYYNGAQIAKSLTDNGFFSAKHTINLNSEGARREISNQKELEDIINKEKEAILRDKTLRTQFEAISKQLQRNTELRDFYRYLQDNEALLSGMNNIDQFKEDVIKSYLKTFEDLYDDWMTKYDLATERCKQIEDEARRQQTLWEDVIDIFNERFFVPFKLEARNRTEIILGDESIIDLVFTYIDGDDTAAIDKDELLKVLSNGEKKPLYILNVLFEIEARKQNNQETLVVVDDLADSFDYQNKYAIIHYLKDISANGLFKLIIMTHNFDFFRTLEGRDVALYPNCLMASKNDSGVTLVQATGIKNVFVNDWKTKFFTNNRKKLASICFLRNLIEMTIGNNDERFLKLTSMLHWKLDSPTISVGDLDAIFNSVCQTKGSSANASDLIVSLLAHEAQACLAVSAGLNLENKIVLAVAIRMAAEQFMIKQINDAKFVSEIDSNQTAVLIDKYKEKFDKDTKRIRIIDRVALMTPENIHVNSFMYEPIVDMSDDHLKRLYRDVLALS
jgi:hypothetical protein